MKTKILSVVLILMMAFSCVTYADMNFYVPAFNYDTLKLEISGNTTNNYSEGVTLSVMPYGTDRATMNDTTVNNGCMLFDYVVSAKDGSFTYSAILNDSFVAGKYAIYADTLSQTAMTTFILINSGEAQPVIDLINSASSTEVKNLIGANCDVLGIDDSEFAKYDTYISNVISASKPEGGYTIEEFVIQYNRAYAMAQLKNGVITMEDVVVDFGSLLNIDLEEYNKLTDAAKTELEALVKAEKGYKGDIMNYDYNYILAQIKTSSGYEEQGGYIVDNAEFIGIDLAKYESIKNNFYKDKVLKKVYGEYTSLEAIVTVWNSAVDECYDEWKNNKETSGSSGGSGGGGGGGGSFGGGIGTDNGFTVTDYDDNENLFTEQGKPQFTEDKTVPFTDVVSHWAYESIMHMYTEGIVNGYEDGTFKPDNTVTRAEFVKMLTGAIELATKDTSGVGFVDVSDSAWYAECVKLAAANSLVQGHDGKFRPLENISRQDAAIVIYNAISGSGYVLGGEKTFNDTEDISDYAKKYVSALAANCVINGSDGNFLPHNTLTRAEAVKLIENLLDYIDFAN